VDIPEKQEPIRSSNHQVGTVWRECDGLSWDHAPFLYPFPYWAWLKRPQPSPDRADIGFERSQILLFSNMIEMNSLLPLPSNQSREKYSIGRERQTFLKVCRDSIQIQSFPRGVLILQL
jgi:hypothetical protein